jgi:ketosteroid isomerase-like protein
MTTETAMSITARLFSALESGNVEAVSELYAEDVAVWHNFSNTEQSKQQNLEVLKAMVAAVESLQYVVLERVDLGDRVLQRHTLTCRLSSGQVFQLPACILVTVSSNKIIRIDEYLDTGQANALRLASDRPPIQPWLG